MEALIDGQLVSIGETAAHWGVPVLDGELRSSAEILEVIADPALDGGEFYLRGGEYGPLDLVEARAETGVTFRVFPRERVEFTEITFGQTANLEFDGNAANFRRAAAGGFPDQESGLWVKGPGVTGFDIPAVRGCMVFTDPSATEWTENITFRNFRLGDATNEDQTQWRNQHGVILSQHTRNIVFEDFMIGYLGGDLADFEPVAGAGDFEAGGFGIWWFGGASADWGTYTFKRGHFCHTMNDFVQYGPKNTEDGGVLFEDCLFEELYNFGDAHADMLQIFGGSSSLTYRGCVFRRGTDFLLHGGNPGNTRLFENCLFGDAPGADLNLHQIVMSKDNEGGPTDYEFRDCTITVPLRTDSTEGAAFTSDCVVSNCIWPGITTQTFVDIDAIYTDDGEPNLVIDVGAFGVIPGLAGDSAGEPTFDAEMNCTSHPQGYRKSDTFPWLLAESN